MGFDWREYLNVARSLSGEAEVEYSPEAAQRCAVSRAYYAAFCHARNYARDRQNFKPSNAVDDHSGIRRHFNSRQNKAIAPALDSLRQWRNQCDYEDDVENVEALVINAIREAQKVIGYLK